MSGGMTNKRGSFLNVSAVVRLVSTKSSDLLLAAFIVSVIALMILPLPLLLIDTLVAANIALGIMLVMMSIYVSSPLQFSAFPSVLLISTLFRLALSVSTTRMILLEGDAGNIINTFGSLVAGGNIVVGLVVFLIITLVQFLVIAKGSERVAEVGARFTLDAMPGKQLSIDSDLRSGLIGKAEARLKRSDLETESKLHGSLDGAMKFVKGDAIAGIVIIIINLLGGLAVGVFQLGMSAGAAMQKYSILTIGDGLVAQIPALFGAMAAGLIVTRVNRTGTEEHLGEAIQNQIASIPRVLVVAGAMCVLFSMIPGFPTGVFLVMGFLILGVGLMLIPSIRMSLLRVSAPAFDKVLDRSESSHRSQVRETKAAIGVQSSPLVLSLPAFCALDGGDEKIRDLLQQHLSNHHAVTGIRLPPVQFFWHREASRHCSLEIFDVPVIKFDVKANQINHQELCDSCVLAIRKNIKLFVGIEETAKLLNRCSDNSPEVVAEIQRSLPLQAISVIVKNLAGEEVPLKNLSVALEALIEASQSEKDLANLSEYARIAMGRQICNAYAIDGVVSGLGLSFQLEEELLGALRTNSNGSEFSISPKLMAELRAQLNDILAVSDVNCVIVPVSLRRHIRELIADKHFSIAVLSYPEIVKPFVMSIVERISISTESSQEMDPVRSGAAR